MSMVIRLCLLAAANFAQAKFRKTAQVFFERGENLLQNGTGINFVFRLIIIYTLGNDSRKIAPEKVFLGGQFSGYN